MDSTQILGIIGGISTLIVIGALTVYAFTSNIIKRIINKRKAKKIVNNFDLIKQCMLILCSLHAEELRNSNIDKNLLKAIFDLNDEFLSEESIKAREKELTHKQLFKEHLDRKKQQFEAINIHKQKALGNDELDKLKN